MERIDARELWRFIPPEEKIDLLNRAHGQGTLAALISIAVASTCAVGLQLTWLLWGSILVAPLIFQFTAGRAWRDLKPRLMLEYLAARSCARRLAFVQNSRCLTAELIFRGTATEYFEESEIQEALEASFQNQQEEQVWVALFSDVVVVMVERLGGARLKFACTVDDKLEIKNESPSGQGDYSVDKVIYLSFTEKTGLKRTISLTSRHPASLIVFEKKLRYFQNPPKVSLAEEIPEFIKEEILVGDAA